MTKVILKKMVGANLCVRPMADFIFRPMANFSIRVFVMVLAIGLVVASCGKNNGGKDDGEEDTGMVTVTINNLSGTGALTVFAEKPVQWNGLDENTTIAWGTLSDYKPEAQLYAGSAGSGMPTLYTGGAGYIVTTTPAAATPVYYSYVSKQKVTLKPGNNTFNFPTDFEILHEWGGAGTVIIRNIPANVDYLSGFDIYGGGTPSEETWIAGMGASGVVGHHRDFLAVPLFDFGGKRYTGTRSPVLVQFFIGFDGEEPAEYVYYEHDVRLVKAGWWCGEVTLTNGRAEIDWNECKLISY